MRLDDLTRLSTRMFKTNPSRTWLTILGMGVGTGAVVLMVGLGYGLQQIILEEIVFGESLLSIQVTASGEGALNIDQGVLDEFQDMERVVDVSPLASFPGSVTYEGLTGNIMIEGLNYQYLLYAGIQISEGESFTEETIAEDSDNVLISPSLLQLFGFEEDEGEEIIGETLSFRVTVPTIDDPSRTREVPINKEFTVKGVTDQEGAMSASILLSELERHVNVAQYERAQVRVVDDESIDPVSDAIIDMGYDVFALSETVEQASMIFQVVQIVLAAFGGVALTVSAIGMFNTMTVTLLERTSEIGIMRTIGAAPTDIKILFLAEATIVGFLGGIVGILMGGGTGLGLNAVLNFVAARFGGEAVALFAYPILFLVFIAIFSAFVGFLTGLFPARRAAKLDPLEAIRD